MTGADGKSFTGEQSTDEPNVWTINIDELSELTDYTITLGDFSQTVRTDGYDLMRFTGTKALTTMTEAHYQMDFRNREWEFPLQKLK